VNLLQKYSFLRQLLVRQQEFSFDTRVTSFRACWSVSVLLPQPCCSAPTCRAFFFSPWVTQPLLNMPSMSRLCIAVTAVLCVLSSAVAAPGVVTMPLGKHLAVPGSRYPGGETVEAFMKKKAIEEGVDPVNQPVGGSIWPVSIFWSTLEVCVAAVSRPLCHAVCCCCSLRSVRFMVRYPHRMPFSC